MTLVLADVEREIALLLTAAAGAPPSWWSGSQKEAPAVVHGPGRSWSLEVAGANLHSINSAATDGLRLNPT